MMVIFFITWVPRIEPSSLLHIADGGTADVESKRDPSIEPTPRPYTGAAL